MFGKSLKNIDINKIIVNKQQPRTVFDEEKIEELSNSIKENGLIQPIIVRKKDKKYEIIAGERRYRACKMAGMKEISCIVEDYNDQEVSTLAIIENIQREDLSPIEEARAYQSLIHEYHYNQSELAKIVGKKQSTIANKLRLLKLNEDVIFAVDRKQITERHARALLSVDKDKQVGILKEVLKKKLNVSQTEQLVQKKPKEKKPKPNQKKAISKNVKIALNTINQATSMIEKTGIQLNQEVSDLDDEYVITIRIKK